MDIEVGDIVRSRYRARWIGEVLHLDKDGIAEVLLTHTRRGVPVPPKKQRIYCYHCNWFKVIERKGVRRSEDFT